MPTLGPLDAVITAYAYANATAALSALEAGPANKARLSIEMLATLDNFLRVVLLSDRVYIFPLQAEMTMGPAGAGERKLQRNVRPAPMFGGTPAMQALFEAEGLFTYLPQFESADDFQRVVQRTSDVLKNVNVDQVPWCVLKAQWPGGRQTMWQEVLAFDLLFLEAAVERHGLQHVKPVFPAEHLYLGLRGDPNPAYTVADLAGRQVRQVARSRIKVINDQQVPLGGLPLPEVPPLFILRLLSEGQNRAAVTASLFALRRSKPFARFRSAARQCHALLESSDPDTRAKAYELIKTFSTFTFDRKLGFAWWFKHGLNSIKAAVAGARGDLAESAEEIFELSTTLYRLIGQEPVTALTQFGTKAHPADLERHLRAHFGDTFNISEMNSAAALLNLPETAKAWRDAKVTFHAEAARLETDAPLNARPFSMATARAGDVSAAQRAFDELWKKAKRVD